MYSNENGYITVLYPQLFIFSAALQIYTAGNGTHVKNVKVTSICRRYYNVEV